MDEKHMKRQRGKRQRRKRAASVFEIADQPAPKVVETIRRGLPARAFAELARKFEMSPESLAKALRMSSRTRPRLSAVQSERVLRAARVWNLARELFTQDEAIARWFKHEDTSLRDAAPVDCLDTDVGSISVEQLIRAVAHGNFV